MNRPEGFLNVIGFEQILAVFSHIPLLYFRFLYLFYNINYNFQKPSKKDKKIHILLDFLMYATEKQTNISCKIKIPESQM